jgi:hypothetical protein
MKRSTLERFMSKYNLAREVELATWESDGSSLSTRFKSKDESLAGMLTQHNVQLETGTYHIYETSTLKNLLGVLSEDFDLKVVLKKGLPKAFQLSDKHSKATYALADESTMPKAPTPNVAAFGDKALEIELTDHFMERFGRAKAALSDRDTFTLISDGTQSTNVIIGYSKDTNTNSVSITVDPFVLNAAFGPFHFSAKYLKEMMSVNKDAQSGTLTAYAKGILQIEYIHSDATVIYFLPKIND